MFSLPPPPPSPAASRASLRRGGPLLFRTIWPEVQASLLEASAPGPGRSSHPAQPAPPAATTAGPPTGAYASAA